MGSVQRRFYPDAFKREAVERVGSSGLSVGKVAAELGIHGSDSAPVGAAGVAGACDASCCAAAGSRDHAVDGGCRTAMSRASTAAGATSA